MTELTFRGVPIIESEPTPAAYLPYAVPETPPKQTERVLYHVRTPSGITLDMTPCKRSAERLSEQEGAHLYELNRNTGRQVRIK